MVGSGSSVMTGMDGDVEQLEAFLQCQSCHDAFKEPRVLPCLHSVCSCCLVRMMHDAPSNLSDMQCPECDEKFKIPEGNVEKLKPNFFIRGLLELWTLRRGRKFICTTCQLVKGPLHRTEATSRCLDCGDFLCDECSPGHRLSSATWTHHIADLQDIQRGIYDDKLKFLRRAGCSKHEGRPLEYFCTRCSQSLCSVCMLVDHRGHKVLPALEAVRARLPAINHALGQVKSKIGKISKNKQVAADYVHMVEDGQETMLSLIHSKASAMVDLVKAEASRAYQKVEDIYKGHWMVADKERARLELQQTLALSCVELAERVLALGNDMEILCLESVLMDRLAVISKLVVSDEVDASRIPNFSIDVLMPLRVVPNSESGLEESTVDMTRVTLTLHFTFDATFLCDKKDPHIKSIAYSRGGLYLADRANCKVKLVTLQGRPITAVSFTDFLPEALAVTKQVVVCLSDVRLHLFNLQLQLQRIVALKKPAVTHTYLYPFAVCRLSGDNFLLCNLEEKIFFVYHQLGELVRTFQITMDHTIFSVISDNFDNIVVGDWRSYSIRVYSQRGDMMRRCLLKRFDRVCTKWCPRGMAVSDNNYIYVADGEHVVIFDEMGEMLHKRPMEKDKLSRPLAVALGEACKILYVVGHGGTVTAFTINRLDCIT